MEGAPAGGAAAGEPPTGARADTEGLGARIWRGIFGKPSPPPSEAERRCSAREQEAHEYWSNQSKEANEAEVQRVKEACAEQLAAVIKCQTSWELFGNMCRDETDAFFRCYRRERGFIHMSVFGKDIDVGGFVAGEETSADATGGDG